MENEFILVQHSDGKSVIVRRLAIRTVVPVDDKTCSIAFAKGEFVIVQESFESLKQKLMGDWIDDAKKEVRKPRKGFTI
jgi:hypothetical protein